MAVGYQSFYQAELTANISETDTTIPLNVVPSVDEGFLVIESTVPSKREIIYFTSKTSNSVIVPSGAGNGRGYDGTTAVSHLQGAAVIMAPVGAMFSELRQQFATTPQGWTSLVPTVSSVTSYGNRSYKLTFDASVASVLSEGMRLRTTRTVAAPVTSFSLNGSNQYFNKTSPAGMTFTDDFTVSAWVYMTAYPGAGGADIESRYNGTSGWQLRAESSGAITLIGRNGGAGNYSQVQSYQSIPLNKWVHIAAQLDMSAFTATTTTSYIMIEGKDVPASVGRAGTNPTALVQAGNLEIGSSNGGTAPFPGQLKDICIYGAKVAQADILARMHQAPTGSEANLISAYTGANLTDLNTTNANNLTAQNSAVSGFANAPYGDRGKSTTLDFGLVMNVDNADVIVQVPEGCTIPTTGGISSVAYSTQANPYGFVADKGRWSVEAYYLTAFVTSATNSVWQNPANASLSVPIGSYQLGYESSRMRAAITTTASTYVEAQAILSTTQSNGGSPEERTKWLAITGIDATANGAMTSNSPFMKYANRKFTSQTTVYANFVMLFGTTFLNSNNGFNDLWIKALPSGL